MEPGARAFAEWWASSWRQVFGNASTAARLGHRPRLSSAPCVSGEASTQPMALRLQHAWLRTAPCRNQNTFETRDAGARGFTLPSAGER